MAANERQVGGVHYKVSYEHWDFVLACGMQYLEANSTKYIARKDKKGKEVEDLEKALHYVEKAAENATFLRVLIRTVRNFLGYHVTLLQAEAYRFCEANDIQGAAQAAIVLLTTWRTKDELIAAMGCIRQCIKIAQDRASLVEGAKPVPLTDSNKHADRAS